MTQRCFLQLSYPKEFLRRWKKKGRHKARLLSTSTTPHNPDNAPKDGFESNAIKAVVSGKSYF
jgi:hypothetical protein